MDSCKHSIVGEEYNGHVAMTSSGATCLPWASIPFASNFTFSDENINYSSNYCRYVHYNWAYYLYYGAQNEIHRNLPSHGIKVPCKAKGCIQKVGLSNS